MPYPQDLRNKAIGCRKKGLSVTRIANRFGIAKSTISLWMRSVPLSAQTKRMLMHNSEKGRAKGRRTLAKRRALEQKEYEREAKSCIARHKKMFQNADFLKICTAILFWCEGGKRTQSGLRFTNSDPEMIRSFMNTLRSSHQTENKKFRVIVHIHEYHNDAQQKRFWSRITKIPLKQFHNSYRKPNTKKRLRDNYPGCVTIYYHDARIAKKVTEMYRAVAATLGV